MSFLAISKIFNKSLVPIVLTVANMLTNIAMVFAPMLAEMPNPLPLLIFVATSTITLILLIFNKMEGNE